MSQARIYSALALKNIQASLMFLARLCYIFGGSEIYRLLYIHLCKIIVPPWIETRTAYKWVINVRIHLYAVYLSSSTFSSVVHFRCRLHFWVQTLKEERFSGWILSVGGRFRPKRLAARPFNFQGLMYYLRRRAKERGEWRNRETHISQIDDRPNSNITP